MQYRPAETINELSITFYQRKDSSLQQIVWLSLRFNVVLSKNAAQNATCLFWLTSLQVRDHQITILIPSLTKYESTPEIKLLSITAVDATCQRCNYIHQKPGLRRKRLFFFFYVTLRLTEPLELRHTLPWPLLPEETLASGLSGRRAISERLDPSLFLPSLYSSIRLSFGEPTRAVVIATGRACWCPWGLLLDRILWRPLPAKDRAPSAERLCMFADV